MIENKDGHFYEKEIITSQANKMNLKIETKNDKLCISCFSKKEYITTTFSNSFSLEDLQKESKDSKESKFYGLFDNIEDALMEIKNKKINYGESIEGNEENSKQLKLIISLPFRYIKFISFDLNKEEKSPEIILKELNLATNYYKDILTIYNFNSKILMGKNDEKHRIKEWISSNKKLRAIKLYFFYDLSYDKSKNSENENINENKLKNDIINFHKKCDHKKNILLICKSKKEIFGGYTPACFDSSGKYEFDPKSFLFSITNLEKYTYLFKENFGSIFCHKNFGPSFNDDLKFLENKMNVIKSFQKSYNTPNNCIKIENCFSNSDEILLDSLEIFQIIEEEDIIYKDNEEDEDNNSNNNVNKIEINNNIDINNDSDSKNIKNEKIFSGFNIKSDKEKNKSNTLLEKINESDTNSELDESKYKGNSTFRDNFNQNNTDYELSSSSYFENNGNKEKVDEGNDL